MDKRPVGRPALPAAQKRGVQLKIKVTPAERELIEAAAGDRLVTVWARDVLLRAARRARP